MKESRNSLTVLCGIMMIIHFGVTQGLFAKSQNDAKLISKHQEQSDVMADKTKSNQINSLSMVQIGGNYTYVNIKPGSTQGFHGNMGGAQGLYEYRPLNSIYAALKVLWRQGNTSGQDAERFLLNIDVHERLGYTLASKHARYLLTLFTGFGCQYLSHHLTQNHSFMKLHYVEFYVPVGFLSDFKINSVFSMGVNFTWMPQVDSTVALVPIGGSRWELKRRLANFLAELPLKFSMGEKKQYSIIFKPFYEYWQNGPSTAVTSSNIPLGLTENSYNFFGTELNFGYKF